MVERGEAKKKSGKRKVVKEKKGERWAEGKDGQTELM
jgi:hypothetical protein